MSAGQDFRQLAEAAFAPLAQRHGLRPLEASPQRLELGSERARLTVSLERDDLFVEVSSTEESPLQRLRVSLPELIESAAAAEPRTAPAPRAAAPSLRQRLETAATLLEHHGAALLDGDFSLRPRILQRRAREWLESKYHDIVEARLYANAGEGYAQVKWEYGRFRKDQVDAASNELERWLESEDPKRREFAERVVAAL